MDEYSRTNDKQKEVLEDIRKYVNKAMMRYHSELFQTPAIKGREALITITMMELALSHCLVIDRVKRTHAMLDLSVSS